MSSNILAFCHVDSNFRDIEELVKDNHTKYFNRHYIDFNIIRTEEIYNLKQYWTKIIALNELLSTTKYDWYFMFDIDCLFVKQYIPLNFFVDCVNSNHELLVCTMANNMVDNFHSINIGAVFFKNTDYIRNFVKSFIAFGEKYNFSSFEQVVFQQMIASNFMNIKDRLGIFPEHSFNHGGPKSFLYHACTHSTSNMNFEQAKELKKQDIKKMLDKVQTYA